MCTAKALRKLTSLAISEAVQETGGDNKLDGEYLLRQG